MEKPLQTREVGAEGRELVVERHAPRGDACLRNNFVDRLAVIDIQAFLSRYFQPT